MRTITLWTIVLPIVGALMMNGGQAGAYVLGGCGEASNAEITFKINPNIADTSAGTTEEEILAHLTGAYDWNNDGRSPFDFQYGGTTTIDYVSNDGTNALFASDLNGNGVLAVTYCQLGGGWDDPFDIRYYDRDVKWSGPGDPDFNQGEVDLWAVTAHELGHALGLGHTPVFMATMYQYYLFAFRELHDDDIAGVQARYSGEAEIVVQMFPDEVRATFGPSGGTWTFDATVENTTSSTQTVDIWFDARLPNGATYGPLLGPFPRVFSPGQVLSVNNITFDIPAMAPPGVYVVRMKAGDYSSVVDDESNYGFLKTSSGSLDEGEGDFEWLRLDTSEDQF